VIAGGDVAKEERKGDKVREKIRNVIRTAHQGKRVVKKVRDEGWRTKHWGDLLE